MGLLLLFDATGNALLWGVLLVTVGLTYWEVKENNFTPKYQMWWLLFVLLVHVPGYLALRVVTSIRRRREPI